MFSKKQLLKKEGNEGKNKEGVKSSTRNKSSKNGTSDVSYLNNFIKYLLTFNKQHQEIKLQNPEVAGLPFRFNISPNIIESLSKKCKSILQKEPNLLKISAPVHVFGDIHGQFSDMIRFLEMTRLPPETKLLFLGDYVDRGNNSIEVVILLFALKIRFPNQVFMIRGNHECANLNDNYGFREECTERYKDEGDSIWSMINDTLHHLPLCALINEQIFCTHGGISPSLNSLEEINNIQRGTTIPDEGVLCDLTWADPKKQSKNWADNDRGVSFTFSEKALDEFIKKHNIQLVCRAHQVVDNGYRFFDENKLVTVFSAPNYCGEVGNNGSVMLVNEELECSFIVMKPVRKMRKRFTSLSTLPQE